MKRYPVHITSVLVSLALLLALPGMALAYDTPTPTPAPQASTGSLVVHLPLVFQSPTGTITPPAVVPAAGKWTGYLDDTQVYYVKFTVPAGGAELGLKEIYANFNGQCDVDVMKYDLSSLPATAVENGAFTFQVSNANVSVKVSGVFSTPTAASGTYRISITRPWTITGSLVLPP